MSALPASASMTNALDQAQTATLAHAGKKLGKSIDAAAEDFEAMFVSQMIAPMFAGLDCEGEFDGGSAEQSWRGMMINEYGKSIAKAGGIGIAAPVKAELLRLQEGKA